MARRPKSSLADETKGRIGLLALVIATICFVCSVVFFLSKDGTAFGMEIGQATDIWGWLLMLVSMFLAVTGLSIAVTMSNR